MWSKAKRRARGAIDASASAVWSAVFAIAGLVSRSNARRWSPLGGGCVLAIAPHPDDESTGCGGTLARHVAAGDRVVVLQVTDGRASRAGGLDAATMAERRAQEARDAAKALGVTLESCGLPEGDWHEDDLVALLRARLVALSPRVIYAPSCVDFHPDHVRVARACARALDVAPDTALVRMYEISVPLGPILATCVCDTSDGVATQDAALAAYATQQGALKAIKRLRRYWSRYYRTRRGAEVFWELRPRDYQAVLARGDWLGSQRWSREIVPYRSLRSLAVTDIAAFCCGVQARRALRRFVDDQSRPTRASASW